MLPFVYRSVKPVSIQRQKYAYKRRYDLLTILFRLYFNNVLMLPRMSQQYICLNFDYSRKQYMYAKQ